MPASLLRSSGGYNACAKFSSSSYLLILQVGAKLVVLNLSQQTDSGDLLGGFRPVQPAEAVLPLLDRFADLVRRWPAGRGGGRAGGPA